MTIQNIVLADFAIGIAIRGNNTYLTTGQISIKAVTSDPTGNRAIVIIDQARKNNLTNNLKIVINYQSVWKSSP